MTKRKREAESGSDGLPGLTYLGVRGCAYALDARLAVDDGAGTCAECPSALDYGADWLQPDSTHRYTIVAGPPQYLKVGGASTYWMNAAILGAFWPHMGLNWLPNNVASYSMSMRFRFGSVAANLPAETSFSDGTQNNRVYCRRRSYGANSSQAGQVDANVGVVVNQASAADVLNTWRTLGISVSAGQVTFYENGAQIGVPTAHANPWGTPLHYATIGVVLGTVVTTPQLNSGYGFATGWIRALSAAEHASLHTQFAAVYP